METLTLKQLKNELFKLRLNFSNSEHTTETLAVLVEPWFKSFKDWGCKQFSDAALYHMQTKDFFPEIHDMYTAYDAIVEQGNQKIDSDRLLPSPAIDDEVSAAQAERNRALCKITMEVVLRDITPEEGTRKQEELMRKPL